EAGSQLLETHTESQLGHEEIYFVLRGRALFTIDGNEHELAAGQLVFVRDPSLERGAIAVEADAVVLALGGKPGQPHEVSAWGAAATAVTGPATSEAASTSLRARRPVGAAPRRHQSTTTSRGSFRTCASTCTDIAAAQTMKLTLCRPSKSPRWPSPTTAT